MDAIELRVSRKNTAHFIKSNPETFTISRGGAKTSDGAGGFTFAAGAASGSVTGRLVPAGGNIQTRNVDGEEIQPAYVLIAPHDASLLNGDVLVKDGRNYEVAFVRPDHDYETWAELIYRG